MSKNAILTRNLRVEINSHEKKEELVEGLSKIANLFKKTFDEVETALHIKKAVPLSAVPSSVKNSAVTSTTTSTTKAISTAADKNLNSSSPKIIAKVNNDNITSTTSEKKDSAETHSKEEESGSAMSTVTTTANKIIDPEIKEQINQDPNAEIIKDIINNITPDLIASIDAAHKDVIIHSPLISPVVAPANTLASPVIDEKTREQINQHTFKSVIKDSINKFVAKFLPKISDIVNKETKVLADESEQFIASKLQGEQGKEIAKVISGGIDSLGHQLADELSLSSTKIIDSDLKSTINNHPLRNIISKFLNDLVPTLLVLTGEILVIGGEVVSRIADAAIEKVVPGSTGREIGTTVEHLIQDGSKELAGLITNKTVDYHHTDLITHH